MNRIWSLDEEAERLSSRFDSLKGATGMTKAKFARENNVPGGASMLNQHIKGHRPISMAAAIAYAKGFKCQIDDISPRIALDIKSASTVQGVSANPHAPELPKSASDVIVMPTNRLQIEAIVGILADWLMTVPPHRRHEAGSTLKSLADHPEHPADYARSLRSLIPVDETTEPVKVALK